MTARGMPDSRTGASSNGLLERPLRTVSPNSSSNISPNRSPPLGRVVTTQDFYAKLVRRDKKKHKYVKFLPRRKTSEQESCVVAEILEAVADGDCRCKAEQAVVVETYTCSMPFAGRSCVAIVDMHRN